MKKPVLPLFIGMLAFPFMVPLPAEALLITHSEAHVSNIQVTPGAGTIVWHMDPWVSIAAAGAFDDPSGWNQQYDDDPDMNGEALATAGTLLANGSASVSATARTIDVFSDVVNPTNTYMPFFATGLGVLYNVFEISEPTPTPVIFSMDYLAELSGQASGGLGFSLDYGISMIISDGATDWTRETHHVIAGYDSSSSHTAAGTLAETLTLQPGVLYSLDIAIDPNPHDPTPEPSTLLLIGTGLAGLRPFLRRRKGCASPEK